MRIFPFSIAIAMLLCGCLPSRARKDSSPQAAALPMLDMKLTVTVLDEETGKPIPDAWVLVAAHITTDRPAPSGDLDAIAAARSITGQNGTAWIRKTAVKVNLPPVFVESKDLKKGLSLTIRMRKPRGLDDWAKTISFGAFLEAMWLATSVDTGMTEEEQRRLYWLFGRALDRIGLRSGKMEHVESFSIYLRDEAIKYYVGHAPKPEDQDSTIQLWLAQKALEVLPQDSAEVKEHIGSLLKGVADEGKAPRWKNHFLDPKDPTRGLPGADAALEWAAVDADNARNDWDWQDAQRYFAAGDKPKAYEALGHVLRLLVNLAIPKYTQMREPKETEFESAVLALMKDQAGQLPPDYWWATKEPTAAKTPRARFDDVAQRAVALGLEAGGGATNGHTENPALAQARKSFPAAIGQAAGLLRDFQGLMHLATFAKKPDERDGGGGTQAGTQASSTTATDTNKFNKFTSGTDTDTPTKPSCASTAPSSGGFETASGGPLRPCVLREIHCQQLHDSPQRQFRRPGKVQAQPHP